MEQCVINRAMLVAYPYRDGFRAKRLDVDKGAAKTRIIQYIKTIEQVRDLFCDNKVYNVFLGGDSIKRDYLVLLKQDGYGVVKTKSGLILVTRRITDEPKYYKTLNDMLAENVSSVCIFNLENGSWEVHNKGLKMNTVKKGTGYTGVVKPEQVMPEIMPKNVRVGQLKKCIYKSSEEFSQDLMRCSEGISVEFAMDGLTLLRRWADDEDIVEDEEMCSILSKYYGVNVLSVHIDDSETPIGVWIEYQ